MLFKSQLFTQGSGSAGGLTASRNRYGQYFRARVLPVNPNSTDQQAVRNAMTTMVQRWIQTLTPAQRIDWANYATNVPVVNKLGESIFLTGQNMYVRSNVQRLRNDPTTIVDDAPTIYNLGTFTPVQMTIDTATGQMSLAFTDTDAWAGEIGGFMFLFVSRPMSLTRNFFGGPYRDTGTPVEGAVVPPSSPQVVGTYPFGTLSNAVQVRVRATVATADGRYTSPQSHTAILV